MFGLAAGVAASVVLPRLFRAVLQEEAPQRPSAHQVLRGHSTLPLTPKPNLKFVSKRDAPESAGVPIAEAGMDFNLPGGAPGPRGPAEKLSVPGRAGKQLSYDDPSQTVRSQRKTLNIRGR